MSASRDILNLAGGLTDRLMTRIPDFMLGHNTLCREAYLEQLAFYASWPADQQFFPLPETPPDATQVEAQPYGTGERVLFKYRSRFMGHNPALQAALAKSASNQEAYLHLWRHDSSASRPLVLCVHGFGMAGPSRAERMFKISRLFDKGLDVALYHLPHHWRRSAEPPNNPFLRPQDLPFTIEEWVRNVHDLHSSVLWLRSLGYARVGLIGASLGGLSGALYATRPAPLDFIFLVVPATDLTTHLMPRGSRMQFRPDDAVRNATRSALLRITPSTYAPGYDVERIAIVAHEGDRICPVQATRELVQRWKITNYTEVVGGHWVYLDRQVRGRTWYGWLARQGYL
ncbi:MAG TPA: alpha/beta hydrolase [Polyangiales bacterium]